LESELQLTDGYITWEEHMAKNIAVFALCANRGILDDAIESLRAAGFRNTDISVLFAENEGSKDLSHVKATKAPEGAAAGAASGAIVGGAVGWLMGVGSIAIPDAGLFVGAGPIVAALAGVGAGGAICGIAGALLGFGIPEYEAKRYEGRVRKGGILLSVHCDDADWTKRAKEILAITGAEDLGTANEARADFARSDRPRPRRAAPASGSSIPFERDDLAAQEPANSALLDAEHQEKI
jgi:hypothetical protein